MLKYLLRVSIFSALVVTTFSETTFAQCGSLVWSDEFDGNWVDETKWAIREGDGCNEGNCGYGNAELQYYSRNNLDVSNGQLTITATNVGNNSFTSGAIWTKGLHSWKYGRFECRAKLPVGAGAWPAFWMLPDGGGWPTTGELDIMEGRGDWPSYIAGTLHYGPAGAYSQHDADAHDISPASFADEWHVFAAEWEAGEIRWYMDDILFKTETMNPATLNPGSNGTAWPWDDDNFYIIVNLAVGSASTPYTGNQEPNIPGSTTFELDYVRVYSSAIPQVDIDGPERLFEDEVATYSVATQSGWSMAWDGTDRLTANGNQTGSSNDFEAVGLGGSDVKVDISHSSGECAGQTFSYTKSVSVIPNNCAMTLLDYDGNNNMSIGFFNGSYAPADNPGSSSVNSSANTYAYDRNGGQQYDVLQFNDVPLNSGAKFDAGQLGLEMDVYTDAPIGTRIDFQLANQALSGNWPVGVHSLYYATTTVQNAWETLTFVKDQNPDPNYQSFEGDLDRINMLFNPNSFTAHTYYIDNIRQVSPGINEIEITGKINADANEVGVQYVATGGAGSSDYKWSLPTGASIASGTGTNSITVDFAGQGGLVTAKEFTNIGCYTEPGQLAVSVGGNACSLFGNEFELDASDGWIETTDPLIAGFSYQEIEGVLNIVSSGHDEWASIKYDINDGNTTTTLDFSDPTKLPEVRFRAKASENMALTLTLVDANGRGAGNQWLQPLNTLEITTEWQDFTIDFSGQMWDEWVDPGVLDTTAIDFIRMALNGGYTSFPPTVNGTEYNTQFEGTLELEYLRIGADCGSSTIEGSAQFEASAQLVCKDASLTFESTETSLAANHSLEWDFGVGANPATAEGLGPHSVSFGTTGTSTVTAELKKNGVTVDSEAIDIAVGCVGIAPSGLALNSTVFPSISNQGFVIRTLPGTTVVVLDGQGRVVLNTVTTDGDLQFGSDLSAGLYSVQLLTKGERVASKVMKVQ